MLALVKNLINYYYVKEYDCKREINFSLFFCLVFTLGNMYFLEISGYGYPKSVCQNVTYWFLNKYLPRHKINIEILHRRLKSDGVCGYCDVNGSSYKPRNFLIELDTYMKKELYIKTLLHELVHLKQWVIGSLREKRGKMYYDKELINNYEYLYQPHEIEARKEELILYDLFTNHKEMWTVQEAAHKSTKRFQFVVY